ncbi:MAG: ImmA/IrrE family metallo-endopeptidase [Alphaproteobacteria bacterium]|nr:ImmA/IrrE family metallo-endopeptidase [Alphaproteobacteria bacterium]
MADLASELVAEIKSEWVAGLRRNLQLDGRYLSVMRMPGKIGNKEAEANLFAATLLMPVGMVRQTTLTMRKWREPDLPKIIDLAGRYAVSKEAMARRIMDLTENACAVVFSHNGIISYPYRSKSFPYVDVANGASLPKYSVTARQPYSPGNFTDWTEVRLDVWLKGDLRRRGELFEQCLDLAGGHRITLLSFDEE